MLKIERHEAIINLCSHSGIITVADVSQKLGVSEMTIRRDFQELANLGKIIRVHGGARLPTNPRGTSLKRELRHEEKLQINPAKKEYCAQLAAKFIVPGDTIFLGGGTTINYMVNYLPSVQIRVVTNSIPVFASLSNSNTTELHLIGGIYRSATGVLTGSIAEKSLQTLGVDRAFVGTTGIFNSEVFGSNAEIGSLLRAALNRAEQRFLVADSSKINQRDFYSFYRLNDFNALITDAEISQQQIDDLSFYTSIIYK